MRKNLLLLLALTITGFVSSCNRSSGQFWEDTKTASRYVGKGFKSLLGKHTDSGEIAFEDQMYQHSQAQSQNVDFIALKDGEIYQDVTSSNMSGSYSFDQENSYPLSRESPGDPGSPIPGIEGFIEATGKLAAVFAPIHFDTDNYTVQGRDNLEGIQAIADYLKTHPNTYIFVAGHADERGAAAYNLALGAKRSNSVRSYLIQDGVNLDQIFTISYGKERPVAYGHDADSWSANRRADFKIFER